jgi:hypothetical protein
VEKPEINLGNLNPQQLSTLSSPEVSL